MMDPTSRHARRRRETRERLLEAAAFLFAQQGVQDSKVSEICERADVAQQTFFNHFPAKQDVVRALVRLAQRNVSAAIASATAAGGSTGERIARLFESIQLQASEHGALHQDLLSTMIRAANEGKGPDESRSVHRALAGLVEAGRAGGDVSRSHAVEDQVDLLFGALYTIMSEWAHREGFDFAERSGRMARLLADALAPRAPRLPC